MEYTKTDYAKYKTMIVRQCSAVKSTDKRVKLLEKMFKQCSNEREMDRIARDIIMERTTINEALRRRNLM